MVSRTVWLFREPNNRRTLRLAVPGDGCAMRDG